MTITDDEIKRLRALCEAATDAPWSCSALSSDRVNATYDVLRGLSWIEHNGRIASVIALGDQGYANGRFMAEARTALPKCLDEIERLSRCMHAAGLACFIRDGSAEQVAEHLRGVAASWVGIEAERDALQNRLHKHLTSEAFLELKAEVQRLEADIRRMVGCPTEEDRSVEAERVDRESRLTAERDEARRIARDFRRYAPRHNTSDPEFTCLCDACDPPDWLVKP